MPDDAPAPAGNGDAPAAADAPPAGQPDGDRLTRVEEKVDRLADAIARLIPGSRQDAAQRTEQRLDRPSTMQEAVRAELQRAREEEQQARAADAEKSEREQIKADLAKLREVPPAPPVPRRTRVLGWGD